MVDSKAKSSYEQAVAFALNRLAEVDKHIESLERERFSLRATIASLNDILHDGDPAYSKALLEALKTTSQPVQEDLGLTDSCESLLRSISSDTPITATDAVQMLEGRGFDVSRYKNPVATVQSVLNRLCAKIPPKATLVGRTKSGRPMYAAVYVDRYVESGSSE